MNHTGKQKIARNAYDWLADFFSPPNLAAEERSRRTLTALVVIASIPVLFGYSFFHFFASRFLLAGAIFFSGVIILVCILIARKKADATIFYRLGIAAIGLLFLYLLGTAETYPGRMFWTFIFPLESLYLLGRKEGLLYTAIYYLIAMTLVLTQSFGVLPGDHELRFKVEYLFSLLVVSLISYCFEFVRFQYQEIKKWRQASLEAVNQQLSQEIEKRRMMEQAARDSLLELKNAQSQLIQSAKLASIGELASGVAHELNQPLMVIRGIAQLLRRNLRKNNLNNEELMGQLDPIVRNTKRMMNIINHLRTFSRQSTSDFAPVDVNQILEDSFLMIGEQLRLRNIQVNTQFASDLPKIKGDPNQLEQVFLNLITNARDAVEMRDDGQGTKNDSIQDRDEYRGIIILATKKGVLSNQTSTTDNRQSKDFIEILIRDNGGGISAERVENIFDPFFTTKAVGKGTGLGLSISYGIIKDHQGEIEVAETGPEGTTFRIRLPVSE